MLTEEQKKDVTVELADGAFRWRYNGEMPQDGSDALNLTKDIYAAVDEAAREIDEDAWGRRTTRAPVPRVLT